MIKHFTDNGWLEFETKEEYDAYILKNHPPIPQDVAYQKVGEYVDRLKAFTDSFIRNVTRDNIILGIGDEPAEVVQSITDKTFDIVTDIERGFLKNAIAKIQAFPDEDLDAKYLTRPRLTSWANELLNFLTKKT